MLTIGDCIVLCDMTDEEIAAIAEHEHIPAIAAAELGRNLIETPQGIPALKRIILDDIQAARKRGDGGHALHLLLVLRHFVEHHAKPARQASGTERS